MVRRRTASPQVLRTRIRRNQARSPRRDTPRRAVWGDLRGALRFLGELRFWAALRFWGAPRGAVVATEETVSRAVKSGSSREVTAPPAGHETQPQRSGQISFGASHDARPRLLPKYKSALQSLSLSRCHQYRPARQDARVPHACRPGISLDRYCRRRIVARCRFVAPSRLLACARRFRVSSCSVFSTSLPSRVRFPADPLSRRMVPTRVRRTPPGRIRWSFRRPTR